MLTVFHGNKRFFDAIAPYFLSVGDVYHYVVKILAIFSENQKGLYKKLKTALNAPL